MGKHSGALARSERLKGGRRRKSRDTYLRVQRGLIKGYKQIQQYCLLKIMFHLQFGQPAHKASQCVHHVQGPLVPPVLLPHGPLLTTTQAWPGKESLPTRHLFQPFGTPSTAPGTNGCPEAFQGDTRTSASCPWPRGPGPASLPHLLVLHRLRGAGDGRHRRLLGRLIQLIVSVGASFAVGVFKVTDEAAVATQIVRAHGG